MQVDQDEITRLKDRDCKRAKLLADKAEAERMAVEKVRDAEKERWEAKLNEREALADKKTNDCKEELDKQYKQVFEDQRKGLNVARAEKRAAWTRTVQANRKVKRLNKQLEKETERMETESESEDADDESEEEDPTARLPFELLPRRDEATGRWQRESPEIHGMRLAQLARGVAPSTTSMNLADVLAVLAPGVELPATSESQSKRLRTVVTIASQMMAAYKFAISTRVLSFGWEMRARSLAMGFSAATHKSSTPMVRVRTSACAAFLFCRRAAPQPLCSPTLSGASSCTRAASSRSGWQGMTRKTAARAAAWQRAAHRRTTLGCTGWRRTRCSAPTRAMAHAARAACSPMPSWIASRRESASSVGKQ